MKAVKCLCGHEEESHVSLRGGRAGCLAADNNDHDYLCCCDEYTPIPKKRKRS